MNYYVYAYLRRDGVSPYYIGKGAGNRINVPHGRVVHIPPEERRVIIKENLCEDDAFILERLLIKMWGRKDTGEGVLHNRTDGGEGRTGVKPEHGDKMRAYWKEAKEGKRKAPNHAHRSIPVKVKGVWYPSKKEARRSGHEWAIRQGKYST